MLQLLLQLLNFHQCMLFSRETFPDSLLAGFHPLLTHQRKAHFPTEIDLAHNDLSPQSLSGIAKSAISKCLDIRASNKEFLLRLKPQDVLELLVGFECRNEKSEIEGCVGYERMRGLGLVPSRASYRALLRYLIEVDAAQLTYHVYDDMINVGIGGSLEEKWIHENLIRRLCVDGKVQEARDLFRKVMSFGMKPSSLIISAIVSGYCDKKDYDDLLSFFADFKVVPDTIHGNKILSSVCRNFGVEEASVFLWDLEELGFHPDEISIVVCLRRGMWIHARGILVEMKDMGVAPDFSTYKVLVAGFCEARQFDEVKAIVCEMLDHSLVKLSATEDPLAKGFELLGMSPLSVKIRRDNDKGFTKAEFFDKLGNGLYLHTDLDEYERAITQVLDDAMIPDFNSYIMEKLHSLDTENILIMEGEMTRWGQEISLPALSSLFCCLCRAPFNAKVINHHFETMPKSTYLLDESTLNLLVRTNCIMGYTLRARTLFDGMTRRGYKIDNGTYSALLVDACKKGDLASLHFYLNLARKSNWLPEVKDGKAILRHLCKNELLSEALELFEAMVFVSSCDILDIFDSLLEGLCRQGFTGTACVLIDERKGLQKRTRTNYENAVELRNMCLRNQTSAHLPFHSAFVNGLCKLGRFEEAARIFMEVKGLVLDAEMCNSSITGYCQRNNLKKIRETLGVMIRKDLSISPSSYSSMVRLICRDGKFSLALSLKELMLRVTCIPELVLYNILIFHISSRRKTLDTVIGALQNRGLQFDDVTFNFVIRGLLLHKDVSHALHYLTTMMRKDLKPTNRTLRGVINSLCHEGELEPALNLSREMELRGWIHGSAIQNDIVEALLSKGRLHEAVGFLDRMVLKGLTPNHIKYDSLIKQFSQYGRVDKAVNLLNVMLQKGSHPEATSYDCLIQGFCNGQKLDVALDFHKEMLCGRVVEAEDLLKSMIQLGETPQREAFNCVINRYREEQLQNWLIILTDDATFDEAYKTNVACNENLAKLQAGYLFLEVYFRTIVSNYAKVISLGIGDTTEPISEVITSAMSKVRGFLGQGKLESALEGMDLVIILAGVPRKPGMTRDDLFNINAGMLRYSRMLASMTPESSWESPCLMLFVPTRSWCCAFSLESFIRDSVQEFSFMAEFWDLILERLVFLLLVGMLEHNSAPSLTGEASLPIDTGGDKFLNQANSRWWDRSGSGKSRSRLSNSINGNNDFSSMLYLYLSFMKSHLRVSLNDQFAGNEPPVLRNQGGLGAEELRRWMDMDKIGLGKAKELALSIQKGVSFKK
ncbi:hypothetical protein SASPL_132060 [Salvia splendens]|uniref:Lactate/malate dehydrogenase N-terminal domain-containing protein n=1 Tax=Salvia splendens TaxID=180675 RepID=A0A8X8ZLG3_SALSN|nr:hypothetical protein SASPL_132060 [Salvia splendens]